MLLFIDMDHVVNALFYPFPDLAPWPEGRLAFYGARMHPALKQVPLTHFILQQHFKPFALELEQQGFVVTPDMPLDARVFDAAFLLLPKNAVEARCMMARAVLSVVDDGWIICAGAADAGGKRIQSMLQDFGVVDMQEWSKYHARVVRARKPGTFNQAAVQAALGAGALQPVLGGQFISQPGLFGWDKADIGSQLLLQHMPQQLSGAGADFGCGYGYLARHILKVNPGILKLDCIDADARALKAARANLNELSAVDVEFIWADLTQKQPPHRYDWIVMNPPFHEGKTQSADIGAQCIQTAAQSLKPRGRLFIVANVQLPYEKILTQHFSSLQQTARQNGFKVFEAVR